MRAGDFKGKHTTTSRELRQAIADGVLEERRWHNYLKLQRELAALARRTVLRQAARPCRRPEAIESILLSVQLLSAPRGE